VVHDENDVLAALSRDDAELARMAARARQRTLEEHSGERRARQLITYLEEAESARSSWDSMGVAS
jgi:hypothetical protein